MGCGCGVEGAGETAGLGLLSAVIQRPTMIPKAKKRTAITSPPSSSSAGLRSSLYNSSSAEWRESISVCVVCFVVSIAITLKCSDE